MKLFSNLAEIVKTSREDENPPVTRSLDPSARHRDLKAAIDVPAAPAQPERRRALPIPKRPQAASARRSLDPSLESLVAELDDDEDAAIAAFLDDAASEPKPVAPGAASMWRTADELDNPQPVKPVPMPSRKSAGRVKTRLLNANDDADAQHRVMENTAPAMPSARVTFPVGWLVVTKGPGRGTCFALRSGVSQIGRDAEETVALDFGDLSISRSNHASIAYDPDSHLFYVGHGGKANIVRLNSKPLLTTEQLSDGDIISMGETSLRLTILCDETFNWTDGTQDDDVLFAG